MTKRQFSDAERYAVYTVHSEKCYMCTEPVDLYSMQVDHVIPESLLDNPAALSQTIAAFNLTNDFNIQSFKNWLPSCGRCNNRKRSRVFEPTPRIQLELHIAAEKAAHAEELAKKVVSNQAMSRAWNTIKRAADAGSLGENIQKEILEFSQYHKAEREIDVSQEPILLSPLIEVISEKNGIRLVKGPYGVGGGPIGPDVHSSFRCPFCGHSAWSGARCVVCGEMSED
ncbi:MAG: HNH endonuclease [Gammaproteobacteria bacterium]|nr:HNH endonuclease [Gammaproteobacteria bacterium]